MALVARASIAFVVIDFSLKNFNNLRNSFLVIAQFDEDSFIFEGVLNTTFCSFSLLQREQAKRMSYYMPEGGRDINTSLL